MITQIMVPLTRPYEEVDPDSVVFNAARDKINEILSLREDGVITNDEALNQIKAVAEKAGTQLPTEG